MAIVIQTLSRSKAVTASHFINGNAAVIGRGYSCDVHVDDPYVCEQHLKISLNDNNEVEVEDAQSVNGVKVNNKQVSKTTLAQDDVVLIGQSRFKIFMAENAVAPTKELNALDEYLEVIAQKRVLFASVAIFALLTTLTNYVNTSVELDWGSVFTKILSGVLAACIVPLVFCLLSMINKKEARLITQFNISFIGIICVLVLGFIISFIDFNTNQPSLLGSLQSLTQWIIMIATFWLLMYVAFHQSTTKRNAVVLSLTAIAASLMYLPGLLDDNDFIGPPSVQVELLSPSLLFTSSVSTEAYLSKTSALFEQAGSFAEESDEVE